MFDKVLIANRGEVALRIMRACKELGIKTVAVYSTEDADTYPVQYADEKVCIGPAQANKSYLVMSSIIAAAINTGAQAIHPGYGFLAENSDFARACADNNLVFIGPSPECIDAMGNKAAARETMKACGVPTVPGSDGVVETVEEARAFAEKAGYPVLVKASAGGGGKGMREVHDPEDLEAQFLAAKNEAQAAFGNGDVYLEKLVLRPRHVEVQVLADKHGNRISLCERDCSLQRRHQKLLEEAPSPALTDEIRRAMGVAAVKAVRATGYENAGTIEFLLAQDGNFYFMEMNTRVQVEHPVTEFVSGVDIVKEQIRIAAGEKLSVSQDDIEIKGHAIECRINAENPKFNFAPSPGKISNLYLPSGGVGLRVDSAVYPGYTIPPYYDSMIAKIIVHGENRFEALMKMQRALYEFEIDGVVTNADFQLDLISDRSVIAGDYDTSFLMETFLPEYQNREG